MRAILSLSSLACLLLAGCSGLRPSPAWETVTSARIDHFDSAAYAEQLSTTLKSAGIAHKVVTYEFPYRTRTNHEAIATRTSVLYRDESSSTRDPWWLADSHTSNPKWLPGEDLDRQLEFHLHKRVTVLKVDGASASSEGTRQLAVARSERPSLFARLLPLKKTERSQRFAAPASAAKASAFPKHQLALFRARHGTNFDPASVMDRVKMERLIGGSRTKLAAR